MENRHMLFLACLLLLPARFAGAAPKSSPTGATINQPEKGPLPVDATVDGLPVVVKNNSASVDVETTFRDEIPAFKGNAVRPFTALLKAYPHVRFINISWEDSNELAYGGANVLYDRVKHTVTVASFDGFNDGNPFGGEVRFTSVRESVFQAILKAHPRVFPYRDPEAEKIAEVHTDNTDWNGFQFLYQRRYGCRSRIIKARHILHQP